MSEEYCVFVYVYVYVYAGRDAGTVGGCLSKHTVLLLKPQYESIPNKVEKE